jgi:post-segregation antitoxin (ccd killing protein)
MVSTKVKREVVEKAKRLGINLPDFLQRKLGEEVEKR